MLRPTLAYLILVFLPAGLLAWFAIGVADREYSENRERYREQLEAETDAFARRLEAMFSDGYREAENVFCGVEDSLLIGRASWSGEVVGFSLEGAWVGFAPRRTTGLDGTDGIESPSDGERRLYAVSLEKGKRLEADPAAALEAFREHLDEIEHPVLRDRLRFRAAGAAVAAAREELAESLYRDLFDRSRALAVDGLPLDLLAGLELIELVPGDPTLFTEVKDKLASRHAYLPTPRLEKLVGDLAPADLYLVKVLDQRRELEAKIPGAPRILDHVDAVLTGETLLVARELGVSESGPLPRAIYAARLDLPRLETGELEAELVRPGAEAAHVPPQGRPNVVRRPVRLLERDVVLADLVVRDPAFATQLDAFATKRDLQRALVGLLVLMTLGGGLALVIYIVKERRLAALRTRLLANVSHELKTPVTSIRMFSEMLAEDPLDEKRTRRFGQLLLAESSRLGRIITNLLDFSLYQHRDEELPLELIEVRPALERIASTFEYHARDKGVAFEASSEVAGWPEGENAVLRTNPNALERILGNLLDNALKYRSRTSPRVELSARRVGDELRFLVRDNGRGIPRREQERIFEEFYRVDYDDYSVKGAGLGLAICQRLASKLGGRIEIDSREGVGSTFALVLPLEGSSGGSASDVTGRTTRTTMMPRREDGGERQGAPASGREDE